MLRRLDLYGMKLSRLPRELGQLAALQTLDVRNNNLTVDTLPLEIFNLVELRKLYLASNQLAVLPDQVRALRQLQELDISNNRITKLPDWCVSVFVCVFCLCMRARARSKSCTVSTVLASCDNCND
jgi:Leucine-rich repeat (LRR) protein